jgi:GLPGLI family protein
MSFSSFSQDGYNILFINQYRDKDQKYIPKTFSYSKLVFNDSFIFQYSFAENVKDPGADKIYPFTAGGKPYLLKQGSNLTYLNARKGKKDQWVYMEIPTKTPSWIFSEEQKNILGYTCKKAFWLNQYFSPTKDSVKNWISDSTIVWYTSDIKPATNPFFNYQGIPGTVLEIHDQNKNGWYMRAIAITREKIIINFPSADKVKPYVFKKPKW